MKSIKHYLSLSYQMNIIPDTEEGGFIAVFPDLPGCITCAETMEEVVQNAKDAKKEWFKAALDEGITIPEPKTQYSGQFKIRLPKTLHQALANQAKAEGISLNQYCVYLLSKNSKAERI